MNPVGLLVGTFALASGAYQAASPRAHRLVIEVNVPGTIAFGTVLGNIQNLKKAFAPEPVQVEVVCHGPGIEMLFPSGQLAKRMTAASREGVVFAACANTMKGRHLVRKDLYPFAKVVDAGIAEIVRKQEAGWSYIKGAY